MIKILMLIMCSICCECVYVYSSFWAPLFDPRILNYRVNAMFDPEAGKLSRQAYMNSYGYRGEYLIADLGDGRKLSDSAIDNKVYGDVKFYYTYPGADNQGNS